MQKGNNHQANTQEEEQNMFLKNLDRTMLTFNLHNIAEVCFNHVFKRKQISEMKDNKRLSDIQQVMIDECIEKYMQSFKVVQRAVHYQHN